MRLRRVGRLPVGQAFRNLQERHDGQPTRGHRCLPTRGKQGRTVLIAEECAKLIMEPEIRMAVGEARLGHTRSLGGHSIHGTGV
jgi:hypothetical protein